MQVGAVTLWRFGLGPLRLSMYLQLHYTNNMRHERRHSSPTDLKQHDLKRRDTQNKADHLLEGQRLQCTWPIDEHKS